MICGSDTIVALIASANSSRLSGKSRNSIAKMVARQEYRSIPHGQEAEQDPAKDQDAIFVKYGPDVYVVGSFLFAPKFLSGLAL
jgi:hypothetical protein